MCSAIWDAGLQPIPELVLSPGSEWSEEDVERLVDAVKDTCGGLDPVSIVFTNGETADSEEEEESNEEEEEEDSTPALSYLLLFQSELRLLDLSALMLEVEE
ncbi:hypothetical protein QTG54_012690 [Skeletonema marinoi]|uniref:Uncharacterized protein n=1 Tax=Skeletonema marinoi TaxID=267567 RepID=A0AAD8Y029_9STRA|nr:hypothetical protein QTG54_012690 [Skeletonema marinoi]